MVGEGKGWSGTEIKKLWDAPGRPSDPEEGGQAV